MKAQSLTHATPIWSYGTGTITPFSCLPATAPEFHHDDLQIPPTGHVVEWLPSLLIAVLAAFAGAPAAADPPPAKVEQVIVVFKTHFDIGYTDLARNVVKRYRTSMIDKALDVCDRRQEHAARATLCLDRAGLADGPDPLAGANRGAPRSGPCRRSTMGGWSGTPCPARCTPNRSTWRIWSAACGFLRTCRGDRACRCRWTPK